LILLDANILLYAYDLSSPVHQAARTWLTKTLSGDEPVGLSWPTILAFLRISTNRKIFQEPYSIGEAVTIVDDWLSRPTVYLLQATAHHWPILRKLLAETGSTGKLVMDAHLATLAIEHDAFLITRDRDFAQFQRLRSMNPFATEN
jgi:toxin-antitoxin system PIN domain toxin